ncbi:MAG: ribosome maturation factor RimP [Candidatus Zixiibacteriota bacterium]|jgi:ribosome maturation factor RimP
MELKNRIMELLAAPLLEEGFDIVEIKLARYRKDSRLQIFVDSDNGVRLDDCARLSRRIETIIEENAVFGSGYTLEVSSPGLDRPLLTARDFRRRVGETIQLTFNDLDIAAVKGELISADDVMLELKMSDGTRKINLDQVKMGKILF